MRASFEDFASKFRGKVFIVYSIKEEITNPEVIADIDAEINRLSNT
jgi:hypothetical protein